MKKGNTPKYEILALLVLAFIVNANARNNKPKTNLILYLLLFHVAKVGTMCNNKITSRLQSCDKGQSPIRSQHWMVVIPSR